MSYLKKVAYGAFTSVAFVAGCARAHQSSDGSNDGVVIGGISLSATAAAVISSAGVIAVCQILICLLYVVLRTKRQWAGGAEIAVVSLGVGTMISDAMMHLIPEAMTKIHDVPNTLDHTHSNGTTPQSAYASHNHSMGVWLGLAGILGMVLVMVIEFIVHSFIHQRPQVHECAHKEYRRADQQSASSKRSTRAYFPQGNIRSNDSQMPSIQEALVPAGLDYDSICVAADGHISRCPKHRRSHKASCEDPLHRHHGFATLFDEDNESGEHHVLVPTIHNENTLNKTDDRSLSAVATSLSVVIAELVHHLIDGLAIGIAFQGGAVIGLATALCVLFHEIPLQFTNYVLLIKSGVSVKNAFLTNLAVGAGILPGALAAAIGMSPTWQAHLLMITAGNFLALAFFQMLPEIRESILEKKRTGHCTKGLVGLSTIAVVIGGSIIFLLGLYDPGHSH